MSNQFHNRRRIWWTRIIKLSKFEYLLDLFIDSSSSCLNGTTFQLKIVFQSGFIITGEIADYTHKIYVVLDCPLRCLHLAPPPPNESRLAGYTHGGRFRVSRRKMGINTGKTIRVALKYSDSYGVAFAGLLFVTSLETTYITWQI